MYKAVPRSVDGTFGNMFDYRFPNTSTLTEQAQTTMGNTPPETTGTQPGCQLYRQVSATADERHQAWCDADTGEP